MMKVSVKMKQNMDALIDCADRNFCFVFQDGKFK